MRDADTSAPALPETIVRMLAEHDAARVKMLDLVIPTRDAEAILCLLPRGGYIHLFPDHLEGQVVVYTYAKDLAADIVPAIRALRKVGYKCAEVRDDAENRIRSYCMGPILLHVSVTGIEGATCKYVEVGKREVPIFELRCGAGSDADVGGA